MTSEEDRPGATGETESSSGGESPVETTPAAESESGEFGDASAPNPVPSAEDDESLFSRFWNAQSGPLFLLREVTTSALAVLLVGVLLFTVSGVWPPMVAVESGSMEPHMHRGDLVFITEPNRFAPDAAHESTSVVTAEAGAEVDYRTFGEPGSVIVYDDPGRGGSPIIHRAEFYVEEGENWYDRADPKYVNADDCADLQNCPAPHAGFITKGDANGGYDQASGIAEPVKPSWITGVARFRIPYLGWVRLGLAEFIQTGPYTLAPMDGGLAGVEEGFLTAGDGPLVAPEFDRQANETAPAAYATTRGPVSAATAG